MNETIVVWKIANIAIMAIVGAVLAGATFGLLLKSIGGESVKKKIDKIQEDPMAMSVYLSASKFAVYYLFATIFTRF